MFTSAIIVAGGSGERFGANVPKQFVEICGKPILYYTLEKFQNCDNIDEIVIVVKSEWVEFCAQEIVEKFQFNKVSKVVSGGNTRGNSVTNGLFACDQQAEIVLVHDAVRPFVELHEISKVVKHVEEIGCCALGTLAHDTLKRTTIDGVICETIDRNNVWNIKTPQGFKISMLKEAYEFAQQKNLSATDDCAIVESFGVFPTILNCNNYNIKITTKEDLLFATFMLQSKKEKTVEKTKEKTNERS